MNAYAVQVSSPDNGQSVRWVNGVGEDPCSNLHTFNCVDELVRDDDDYIQTVGLGKKNVDKQFYELSDITDPLSSTDHVLTYTFKESDVGTNPVELTVILYEGDDDVIASWTHTGLPTTFTEVSQTLTASQADSIDDYSDLQLELQGSCETGEKCGNSPSAREKIQVSWIQFSVGV